MNCVISHTPLNRIPHLLRTNRPNPALLKSKGEVLLYSNRAGSAWITPHPAGMHFAWYDICFPQPGGDRHCVAIRQRTLPPPISAGKPLDRSFDDRVFFSSARFFCMEFLLGGITPRPSGNAGPITNGDL